MIYTFIGITLIGISVSIIAGLLMTTSVAMSIGKTNESNGVGIVSTILLFIGVTMAVIGLLATGIAFIL